MFENALWIGLADDMGEICPQFCKNISVKKTVKTAELSLTSVGVYEAQLGNKRIGDFVLAPGCTEYRKRLQYQTYDVTKMLEEENELKITVASGWNRGRINRNSDITCMPCAIIAELNIIYADGTSESVVTDESWKVRESAFCSDIYDGETYDATKLCGELHNVALISELSKDILISQEGEIVCEHERLKPMKYFVTPNGERVIDFGQNLAGYVEFSVNAKSGDRVEMSCAEVMDADGNFYTNNYRGAKSKLTYICRDGLQTYKPHLTFFGFRYIRLDEYPTEINLDDFTAIALYSDIKRTGSIECSNEKLNQLFSNVIWSQRSNFIDIPTDCPQRDERLGWTGDAQVFVKTASYNYNVKKFFEKWMGDACADQTDGGSIPNILPNFFGGDGRGSAAWGDVMTVVPWQIYQMYGDKKILKQCFEAMKKWVDFITADTQEKFLWNSGNSIEEMRSKHFGDWLALDCKDESAHGGSNINLIASAFYAYSTSLTVKAGKALGADVGEYETLYNNIVKTFKNRFGTPETQTEHVLALCFDLTDNKPGVAAELNEMIKSNGYKLKTGFVGTPYLLYALSENGYTDTAYRLLVQEEYPSWLYEVNHGATTIWEHWDGLKEDGSFWSDGMNSFNHYAYGSVMDWVYTVAAGIKTDESKPGFKKAIIAPNPGKQLKWLNAEVETVCGKISSRWTHVTDGIRYEITTPSPADIIIDGKTYSVEAGSYIFYGAEK